VNFPGGIAETIRPIGPKKGHIPTRPRRSDGLIGAFTSSERFEFASQNRLSRFRQPLTVNNQVSVGRTNDKYTWF